MSDTDIYKSRERMPYSSGKPNKRSRRRRSSEQRPFDDQSRKRRSKNSGLRRMLHLYRKGEHEKVFWWSVLICTVVVLGLIAIWQYWFQEQRIRSEEKTEYIQVQTETPEQAPSAVE